MAGAKEHYHCIQCAYKTITKKDDMIRHYKWHRLVYCVCNLQVYYRLFVELVELFVERTNINRIYIHIFMFFYRKIITNNFDVICFQKTARIACQRLHALHGHWRVLECVPWVWTLHETDALSLYAGKKTLYCHLLAKIKFETVLFYHNITNIIFINIVIQ